MKLKAIELQKVAATVKHFLNKGILDDSLRYVSFYNSGIVARNNYAGVLCIADFELEKEFAISFDMFVKISSLFGECSEVVIKFAEDKVKWKFGNYRYTSPMIDLPTINFPSPDDDDKGIALGKGFLSALSKASFSAGSDIRQQNLYGLFVTDGQVWACDNSRAYVGKLKGLKKVKDLFLTREVLTILSGIGSDPAMLINSENKTFFVYEEPNVVVYTAAVGFKYPEVSQFFKAVKPSEATTKVVGYENKTKQLEQLLSVLDDETRESLVVMLSEKKMQLALRSPARGDKLVLSLGVRHTIGVEHKLQAKPEYLIEALCRYDTFWVFPTYIYCEDEDSKHVVMLME